MMGENVKLETYNDFVKQFGERPPDIVFTTTRQAVAREIMNDINQAWRTKNMVEIPIDWWQRYWQKYGVA